MTNWLANGKLTIKWKFAQDEDHEGITQALTEQQQIGWHNFSKAESAKPGQRFSNANTPVRANIALIQMMSPYPNIILATGGPQI